MKTLLRLIKNTVIEFRFDHKCIRELIDFVFDRFSQIRRRIEYIFIVVRVYNRYVTIVTLRSNNNNNIVTIISSYELQFAVVRSSNAKFLLWVAREVFFNCVL